MDSCQYPFDPSYGYSLGQLLEVKAQKEPKDFDMFWQLRYQNALELEPLPQTKIISENKFGWRVFEINYNSVGDFPIRGWLLLPSSGEVKRGFIVGHGYGGRDGPDFHFPFKDAALFFPCFRGLGQSASPFISSDPYWHVLHNIDDKDRYIIGGCVEDAWLAVSALLVLFPHLAGCLGYMGISFGGGIGALALAYETRISKAHLNVPTFGYQSLRLKLATNGSANSVQKYYLTHKKQVLTVLRYYDAAFSAKRIKIPMHCACAKFDPCVAPPGQFAIFNALSCEKYLFVLEAGHHQYSNQVQQDCALMLELDAFFASLGS
ncbi:MAG: deacetylase [Methylococcales bacterium]|nr:MAG: deacetylase [Methylococcales bacterium]